MNILRRFTRWLATPGYYATHPSPVPPPTTEPTSRCQKCGQPFGGTAWGQPRPEPAIRYAVDPTNGERLIRTCPRCGFRWDEPICQ